MKKNLQEQITRMHKLAYGKEVILENSFWDFLSGKDEDDPKQADLVEPDVQALYDNLSEAAATGLNQQEQGHMNYQKEVESMQIGLQLLGYDLPRFGVDGLFGPETAMQVNKFKKDNLILEHNNLELEKKNIEFALAATGMVGFETALALSLTELSQTLTMTEIIKNGPIQVDWGNAVLLKEHQLNKLSS